MSSQTISGMARRFQAASRSPKRPATQAVYRTSPVGMTLRYVALAVLACFSAAPLVISFFNSLKSQAELGTNPIGIPHVWEWGNYSKAWAEGNIGTGLRNSAILVVGTVVVVCVIGGLAAYAMSRLELPGSGGIMLYLLMVNSLPIQLFLVPLFFMWTTLHLYDTHMGLILIYAAVNSPFATLLLRSFMIGIPKDYEDAARIDGAGELRVLRSITLPLSLPGFLTIALTTGLAVYNEFLLALVFIQSPEFMPVATGLFNFREGFGQNIPVQAAAGLTMLAPMLFVFLLLQKRFTQGLASVGLAGT